ncbi:MAG: LytR C-terminal domain-containing protein [Solirubrobacteraceae bacterium]
MGAKAGFAAIIGLAVLVLLYFAQARETATLREHAHEAAQRIQQLETRLAELGRIQLPLTPSPPPVAVPPRAAASVPAASRVPVIAGALTGVPSPPAGVAAPALSAATRLIPTAGPVGGLATASPVPSPDPVAPRSPAPATAAGGNGHPPAAVPASAAPGSPGAPAPVSAGPAPATPPPARPVPPPVQIRAGASAPSARSRRSEPSGLAPAREREASILRRLLPFLLGAAALVVVAVVVIALLAITSVSGSPNSTASTSVRTSNAPGGSPARRGSTASGVIAAHVTVAVLNGTATNGLAGRVSTKLKADGYKPGTVATASDQTRTATVVAYLPGSADRRDAVAVARALSLGPASIQPIDTSTQAVACPPSAPCVANVVVTVGSDLASTP